VNGWLLSSGHVHAGSPGFASLAVMWIGMMAAMMAPTAWPWLLAFERLRRPSTRMARAASIAQFAAGYLSAWTIYAVAAAALQFALSRAGRLDASGTLGVAAGAVVLIGAGLFQFTPWKRACLTHCRNPLSFLLARWHDGPIGSYRLGLSHGWFCVGCCWALMATTLVVGMSSIVWMLALTASVFAEQVVPRGHLLRAPLGVGLVIAGLVRLL
jgi:predicted metal-binding membrane protein